MITSYCYLSARVVEGVVNGSGILGKVYGKVEEREIQSTLEAQRTMGQSGGRMDRKVRFPRSAKERSMYTHGD